MTWDNFQTWLEANIIETKTISKEECTVLREGVAVKYFLTNSNQETNLLKVLEDLIASIENNDNYSWWHGLPEMTSDENYKIQPWSELFPDRTTTFFGDKSKKKILDDTTWIALKNIYEDWKNIYEGWRREEQRTKDLKEGLGEDDFTKEFLVRTFFHLNVDLLKKNGYEQKLVNWLAEYNKLGLNKQEELKTQKKQVEEFLQYLREEFRLQEEQAEPKKSNWWNFLNWQTAIWSAVGTILVLLFIYLWKKCCK